MLARLALSRAGLVLVRPAHAERAAVLDRHRRVRVRALGARRLLGRARHRKEASAGRRAVALLVVVSRARVGATLARQRRRSALGAVAALLARLARHHAGLVLVFASRALLADAPPGDGGEGARRAIDGVFRAGWAKGAGRTRDAVILARHDEQ